MQSKKNANRAGIQDYKERQYLFAETKETVRRHNEIKLCPKSEQVGNKRAVAKYSRNKETRAESKRKDTRGNILWKSEIKKKMPKNLGKKKRIKQGKDRKPPQEGTA